jgi:hypothetical protein
LLPLVSTSCTRTSAGHLDYIDLGVDIISMRGYDLLTDGSRLNRTT